MSVLKFFSGVVKNVLVCSFFLSVLFGSNLILAQNETTGIELPSNVLSLPGIGGSQNNQTRYNFTAEEFLYPIKPGVDRSHLPEFLTFEVVREMDLETLKSKLQEHSWKSLFHCNGRALTVDMFSKSKHLDGVINQSLVETYSFNGDQGVLDQTFYPPEINPENHPQTENRTFNIVNIENLGEGIFKFNYKQAQPEVFTIIKARETNEILIQSAPVNRAGLCPNGERPAAILAPFNNFTS